MSKFIEIAGRRIGSDYPPLVIAEIGINHNGSLTEAFKLVDAAKRAGVEVVKHQTHIPHEEMSDLAKKAIPGNATQSIWDIMVRCALDEEEEKALQQYVIDQGMIFISTPFSFAAVDRLEKMNVPAYKIGSGEMNNDPFVEYVASKGKPVILSTGMNDILAVTRAVNILKSYQVPFVIMHTTNLYPTPVELVRLGALEEIKNTFKDEIIGLSDHTCNNLACLAATALGALVLERHFTDSKERIGEDIICSMTPDECRELICQSAEIARMRGGCKKACEAEQVTIEFAFSTLVATRDIPSGSILTRSDLTTRRPNLGGIPASNMKQVVGRCTKRAIQTGQHISYKDLV